jgi:hypothetical protein
VPAGEQVSLDALQGFMGVVVGLLHQAQLLALVLVEAYRHHVLLLEPLQGQDEQLGVVLVIEGREGDGLVPGGAGPAQGGKRGLWCGDGWRRGECKCRRTHKRSCSKAYHWAMLGHR